MDDSLISPKQPDGFTTESPIRAFTDFQVSGTVAIGKGFRPSLAHLARYLGAMEEKEGWRLVQVILPTDDAGDPTVLFHRVPRILQTLVEGVTTPMSQAADAADLYAGMADAVPDLGAPHDTLLNVKVKSNFGKTHESSAKYRDGKWFFVTPMAGGTEWSYQTEPMRGYPDAWQHPGQDGWNTPDRPTRKSPALAAPYGENAVLNHVAANRDAVKTALGGPKFEMAGWDKVAERQDGIDDPINPKHYGGTACAEIGELLTGNSYQVLKYNWRLGGKDEEAVEIGKSIWYLDREIALAKAMNNLPVLVLPDHGFFDVRLADQSDRTKHIARTLVSWCRFRNLHTLYGLRKSLQRDLDGLNDNGITTGLAV